MKQAERRKAFLKVFLGALGAADLLWEDIYADRIYSTVLYDAEDKSEQQDFVWYMTEQAVPSQEVVELVEYITHHKLLDIDKLLRPLSQIAVEALEPSKREKAVHDLLAVEVKMIDEGVETDIYFMHE